MNLVHRFPPLFWNTANLIVDSGGSEEEFDEDLDLDAVPVEDDVEDEVDAEEDEDGTIVEQKKVKTKTINYGKVGMALGKMKTAGVQVDAPDINKSKFTFTPDIENNSILFGIKGIAGINDQLARDIISNRPYASLRDLMVKVKLNKPKIVNLIKSGALDKLQGRDRLAIMQDYINEISDVKSTLNLRNMQMLIGMELIPIEMDFSRRLYNFNKYLKKFKNGIYYELDDQAMRFFEANYNNGFLVSLDNGALAIEQKLWDKTYTKGMEPMRDYIKANLTELLATVNGKLTAEMWDKYAKGSLSKWEMDSLSYYAHEHELAHVNFSKYGIEDFFAHAEEPEVVTFKNFNGRMVPIFRLWRIAGTVLNRDKTKHIVTILTPTGVVNVRVWQNQFVKYDKQISIRLPNGKKKITEKSWFTRGNKVMMTGIRRGDNFFPKVYKNNRYQYPIELITHVSETGVLGLKGDRGEEEWLDYSITTL